MNWLLWKEYRDQRVVVIAGVTLLLLPHLVVLVTCAVAWCLVWQDPFEQFTESLLGAAGVSVMFSLLTLALLGGNAFAGERSERSADFLAILPISRVRTVCGKIALTLCAVTVILGLNLLIGIIAAPAEVWREFWNALWTAEYWHHCWNDREVIFRVVGLVATTGLMFFCIGWFFSSFSPSSVFAIAGGLVSPALVWVGLTFLAWLLGHHPKSPGFSPMVLSWHLRTCLVLAPLCFVAGTCYYLRRVEP